MGFLDKFFGRGTPKTSADAAIHRTIRCHRCKSLIHVRIDTRNDLSLNDDVSGYFVRKTLVDATCFTRIELEMTFDLRRCETSCDVHGGTVEPSDISAPPVG